SRRRARLAPGRASGSSARSPTRWRRLSATPKRPRSPTPRTRCAMSSDMPGHAAKVFFAEAIARALSEAMARDPRIVVLGQDVGRYGGPYREFAGLHAAFGADRVRDTPVAEAAMIGVGVGAAAAGLRPVV